MMLTYCVRFGRKSAYFPTWRDAFNFAVHHKKWSIWVFDCVTYELVADSDSFEK